MNFFETVVSVLKQDERFFTAEGDFLRNAVYEAAMRMDAGLIKLLLSSTDTKTRFFSDVDGVLVFDKVGFGWVINNRQFLPNSYTRFKNKIGLVNANSDLISALEDVELVFPYKDCVLEGGQTNDEQKRNEIFYNETLAPDEVDRLLFPKAFCKAVRYTKAGQETATAFSDTDNLIIKGNNLLAISSLLKRYEGRVKFIYIDPPYNTGDDSFKYNDKFTHSTWLVFIKNRLDIARKLLSRDGIIIINTDEIEQAYLKVLADSIFGRENFIGDLIWQKRKGGGNDSRFLALDHDYLAVYVKDIKYAVAGKKWRVDYDKEYLNRYKYIDEKTGLRYYWDTLARDGLKNPIPITLTAPDGAKIFLNSQSSEDTIRKELLTGNIKFTQTTNGWTLHHKVFQPEGKVLRSILKNGFTDLPTNKDSSDEISALFGESAFSTPKPEGLIKTLLDLTTEENDLVLDFFMGSATTQAVAHKMKRKYIGVEQMDYINSVSVERLKKVIKGEQGGISKTVDWQGGGSFVYCELAQLNQVFVDRITSAKDDSELAPIWHEMKATGYISHYINPRDIDDNAKDLMSLSFEDRKRLFIELLDKNMLYVNYCDIDDAENRLSETDKAFTKSFYEGV